MLEDEREREIIFYELFFLYVGFKHKVQGLALKPMFLKTYLWGREGEIFTKHYSLNETS